MVANVLLISLLAFCKSTFMFQSGCHSCKTVLPIRVKTHVVWLGSSAYVEKHNELGICWGPLFRCWRSKTATYFKNTSQPAYNSTGDCLTSPGYPCHKASSASSHYYHVQQTPRHDTNTDVCFAIPLLNVTTVEWFQPWDGTHTSHSAHHHV